MRDVVFQVKLPDSGKASKKKGSKAKEAELEYSKAVRQVHARLHHDPTLCFCTLPKFSMFAAGCGQHKF